MSKDEKSLEQSRSIKRMLEQKWGSIPGSIMKADWSLKVIDLSTSYQDQKEASKYDKTPFALSSVGARHGGLSRMPQNIVQWAVKFYCPEHGTILDPFCGHNSRLESVWRCHRNYIGFDISKHFMEMNRKVVEMLNKENEYTLPEMRNDCTITIHEADSRDIPKYVAESSVDFCISSPPFWDLELDSYGPEPEQLGRQKLYGDFIDCLGNIAKSCFKALKPGCFIAWEFNHFRKDGVFYPFFADGMRLFENVGFRLWDVIVIDYGAGFLAAFPSDIEHHHIVSKEHSYLIVAIKPTTSRKEKRSETRERLVSEVEGYHSKQPEQQKMLEV